MKRSVLVMLTVLLVGVVPACATDFHPPPWQRTGPLTVTATWQFGSAQDPETGVLESSQWSSVGGSGASLYNGPEGDCPLAVFGTTWQWLDDGGGRGRMYNTLAITSCFGVHLPNWIEDPRMPVKYLQVQVHYSNASGSPNPPPVSIQDVQGYSPNSTTQGSKISEGDPSPLWHWELWTIRPNPDRDTFLVNVPSHSYVHQIVIDTISTVPEPTSLFALGGGLLSLAGFAIRRRRR